MVSQKKMSALRGPIKKFHHYIANPYVKLHFTKILFSKFTEVKVHLTPIPFKNHKCERLFLGTFQDLLKWLNFTWELKKILLAKFYRLVIRFLICYWGLWVLDLPCENLSAFNLLRYKSHGTEPLIGL